MALTDGVFWPAILVTVLITVITVVVELVLGMIIALVMHDIVLPRRTLRTLVLIPYSIITVVSAFSIVAQLEDMRVVRGIRVKILADGLIRQRCSSVGTAFEMTRTL